MPREVELLTEIRDFLQILAEPLIEKKDKAARDKIRDLVSKSKSGQAAVLLMDGTRTQAAIAKEAKIDPGQLNRLVKAIENASLCHVVGKHPKLAVKLPPDFFSQNGKL